MRGDKHNRVMASASHDVNPRYTQFVHGLLLDSFDFLATQNFSTVTELFKVSAFVLLIFPFLDSLRKLLPIIQASIQ